MKDSIKIEEFGGTFVIRRMQLFKNSKGFTLVELMIVIAVIGILALVLLPKVGSIKTTAKAAGIDTNMRMVEAIVQSKISDYAGKGSATPTADATTPEGQLAIGIHDVLASTTDSTQAIKDPINTWTGAAAVQLGAPAANSTTVIGTNSSAAYINVTGSQTATNNLYPVPASSTTEVGIIYVNVYPQSGANSDIYVTLTPYDASGNPITAKQITIKP